MIYNKYGQKDIKVSALGFGGMRFKDQNDKEACAKLINSAYQGGINYFDTAPGYGKSEDLFGIAFKEMKKTREQKPFYVATKSNKADPGEARKDLENSLTRMGLDYIDFFHMWCVYTPEEYRARRNAGVLDEIEKMKEEGLIKNICLSTHMPGEDIGAVLKDYPFDAVLMGYSAMNFTYRQQGLQDAADLGRAVVVMNPLGGGIIPQHPDKFQFVKTTPDDSVVQGALKFLFNDPRITVSLVGFADERDLNEALSAVETFKPLSDSKVDQIRTGIKDGLNDLCTSCRYCDKCPQDIPVPRLMDAWNHYHLTGSAQDMLDRLKWHWSIPADKLIDKCTKCRLCEKACTQKLPIIERMEFINEQIRNAPAEEK